MSSKIEFTKKNLPQKPGCYIFKNEKGKILYVGKAVNLKNRVKSYWNPRASQDPMYNQKIKSLVREIVEIDFFVVDNETEALLLENELIKKHQPYYNARLRDDKSFPWVQITKERYPRIKIIRRPEDHDPNHEYIGPFVSGGQLRKFLEFIRKTFPYCTCTSNYNRQNRKRPCTNYQIKLCPGPCIEGKISEKKYNENINQVRQLLMGNIETTEEYFNKKMIKASTEMKFEKAAIWRDRLKALHMFTIEQSVLSLEYDNEGVALESPDLYNKKDIISRYETENFAGILIFHVRRGRLISKTPYIVEKTNHISKNFFLEMFQQHYLRDNKEEIILPDEIILPNDILEDEGFKNSLKIFQNYWKKMVKSEIKEVKIREPLESDKTISLYRLAKENAKIMVTQREKYVDYLDTDPQIEKKKELNSAIMELKEILKLPNLPIIIEGFDMSHLQGSDYVGSKVSFLEGKPNKRGYRMYKIKSDIDASDDVGAMKEVLYRRYKKLVQENEEKPDLIVIDGGLPQIKATNRILSELGLDEIPHIGMAKPEGRSEINTPPKIIKINNTIRKSGKKVLKFESYKLPLNSPALHLLQYVRNESHRFAINYHKKLRNQRMFKSELDDIPGIGKARKIKLLRVFETVENIKKATLEELKSVMGEKIAQNIINYFKNNK